MRLRHHHGTAQRLIRPCRLAASSVLLGALLIVAACGPSSSTGQTFPPAPSDVNGLSVRFWRPGVFLVALASSNGAFTNSMTDIPDAITTAVTQIVQKTGLNNAVKPLYGSADAPQSAGNTPPALMVFDHVAIASYQLMKVSGSGETSTDLSDAHLDEAVKAINGQIQQELPAISAGSVPDHSLVKIETGSGAAWLIGATADLYSMGENVDNVGGSPGGPPSFPRMGLSWHPTSGTNGSRKQIYILDTAPGTAPGQDLCLTLSGSTVTNGQPPNCGFLDLPEETFALPSDLVDAGYPYQGGKNSSGLPNDTSFLMHGQFVAKIIQEMSPGATLRLIRVLDSYGAADLRSLLYGLNRVFSETGFNGSNVFVNLSLTLTPLTQCLGHLFTEQQATATQSTTFKADGVSSGSGLRSPANTTYVASSSLYAGLGCIESVSAIAANPAEARLYVPIGAVVQQLAYDGYWLIGAAGNDSDRASGRIFGADMPGAFCSVDSVAATTYPQDPMFGSASTLQSVLKQSGNSLATFSNDPYLTDGTNSDCLTVPVTFTTSGTPRVLATPMVVTTNVGGDMASGTRVCSLYGYATGHWGPALWSGTSFSTPAMTGYYANGKVVGATPPCG